MHAACPTGRVIACGEIKSLGSWRASLTSFSEGRVGIYEDKSLVSGVAGAAERRAPPAPPAPGRRRPVPRLRTPPAPEPRRQSLSRGKEKSLLKR